MPEEHPAELLFERELRQLGASSGTFYIRDPYWSGDLRLTYMPGVSVPEPMHGFLVPESARRMVTSGEDEEVFSNRGGSENFQGLDVPAHIIRRFPFFGNFAQREQVATCARFIHRVNGSVNAVMFANFNERLLTIPSDLRNSLVGLFDVMVECLPSIERNILNTTEFPVSELTRILRPIDNLARIHHGTTSPLLSSYLKRVLSAVMSAFGIPLSAGFGTVHLYDVETRLLSCAAHVGDIPSERLAETADHSLDTPHGVISWVALKKKPLLITHLPDSVFREIHVPLQDDTLLELAVPMMAGDELLGVFNIESQAPLRFASSVDLVRVVSYAANQAAIAARLSYEARKAHEQADLAGKHAKMTEKLLRICSQTSSRYAETRPLDPVAELASEFLSADSCDIWKYDEDEQMFVGVGADYADFHPTSPPRPDGFSHFVRRTKSPVWLFQIAATDEFRCFVWSRERNAWCVPEEIGLDSPSGPAHTKCLPA